MSRVLVVLGLLSLYFLGILLEFNPVKTWVLDLIPNRFRENTDLTTVTPHYTYNEDETLEVTYTPCKSNCSWETSLPNDVFKETVNFTIPFDIDDDQLMVSSMKSQLACVPFSFGFNQEKGLEIFPPYLYPSCESKLSGPMPNISLSTKDDKFAMNCPNHLPGKYLLNPPEMSPTSQYLYTDIDSLWKVKEYPGHPVSSDSSEFALGTCEKDFTRAEHYPKFRPEVKNRTQSIMKERAKGRKIKPLVILFVAVDSFSRRHFFRKLNSTVEFLNELNQEGEFAVFDFKLHNIIGQGSAQNMVPMFTNQSFRSYSQVPQEDMLGPTSLWAMLKTMGYTTFLGFEDCDYHFPVFLGRDMNVDHLVRSFYCATFKYLNVKVWSWIHEQRCVGPHMSHYYTLNYTHAFTDMYRGDNQFIYIHLDAAHEETGQHAATLDPDLREFLTSYIADYKADNDLAIFVQADHGMRYGSWYKDIEAHQESKLPAFFFLTQREVLDRFPNSYDTLWHNSHRLMSQRDLRATILALSLMPYGETYPVHEYEPYLSTDSILFQEKIKDSRTCDDVGIPPWCCSCLPTERISSEVIHSWGHGEVEALLMTIVEEALRLMNVEVYTPNSLLGSVLCKKLSFDFIVKAYGSKVGLKTEEIQVEFRVQESLTARFEAFAIVGSNDEHILMGHSKERNSMVPGVYRNVKVRVRVRVSQVIDIVRKDKYKSECEIVSRRNGIKAEYCMCNDLEELKERYPELFGSGET